jgi:hypothetical protein
MFNILNIQKHIFNFLKTEPTSYITSSTNFIESVMPQLGQYTGKVDRWRGGYTQLSLKDKEDICGRKIRFQIKFALTPSIQKIY